ncbi:uncharacterized protein LOC124689511 [Lolium rigidum]|uniref:uncharacterized protein LOC124689511 n=1 Tax=Lolium rigidum TaxID=89674 RepID=UPI001F5DE787|nr:uncharacterized protein LOC124689511 [Lolium rigidum]
MPSPSLLLPLHHPPFPPRFASSRYPPRFLRAPPRLTPTPRLALPPLRLPAVAARASGQREIRVAEGDGRRAIPIARCYDAGLARLEVAGAARREQILQAKEVQEKASKIKKDYGDDFFSENEPDSDSILAMALKQVVPVDFSISSSDGKLLSALAEAIFSCVIEDTEKNYLGGTAAFKNTELKGCHELTNNRREVLVSHFQLGMFLTCILKINSHYSGKTFHSHWNAEPSKIRKNNGYLNKLFAFLAGSSVILIVGVLAQLFWPQSLKDKSLFMGSSCSSSPQRYCSDVHSLDNSEVRGYCVSVVKKIKDSCGCPGDIVVDENIGAWVGELPDCFKAINLGEYAASDDARDSRTVSQETENLLVSSPTETTSHLEQKDNTRESLQNIASFQVVMSEQGKLVGFQPTSRLAVSHWANNPLAALLYEGRKLSPAFLEPRLKLCCPAKVVPIELLMSVNSEPFFALARPVQDPC